LKAFQAQLIRVFAVMDLHGIGLTEQAKILLLTRAIAHHPACLAAATKYMEDHPEVKNQSFLTMARAVQTLVGANITPLIASFASGSTAYGAQQLVTVDDRIAQLELALAAATTKAAQVPRPARPAHTLDTPGYCYKHGDGDHIGKQCNFMRDFAPRSRYTAAMKNATSFATAPPGAHP
jgi:hypothetical protein